MAVHKLAVELSDEELTALKMLADLDGISPSQALKRAITQVAYLRQEERKGRDVYVGTIVGDSINVGKVRFNH